MNYNFAKAPTTDQISFVKCKKTITEKFAIKIKKTRYYLENQEFIICEIQKIPIILKQISCIN